MIQYTPHGFDEGEARSVAVRSYYHMSGWDWFATGKAALQYPFLAEYCDHIAELAPHFYQDTPEDRAQASRDAAQEAVKWYGRSLLNLGKGRIRRRGRNQRQSHDMYVIEKVTDHDDSKGQRVNPLFEFPVPDATDRIVWQELLVRMKTEVRARLAERLTEKQMQIYDALLELDGDAGDAAKVAKMLGVRHQYVYYVLAERIRPEVEMIAPEIATELRKC